MNEIQNVTSSPIIKDVLSSDCESITETNPLFLKNKCFNYHEKLDTIHGRIYRYYTFMELLHYLQSTVLVHLPYIDYPTDEILMMILTATQLNHVEDKASEELINLSIPSINYINSLLDIFDSRDIDLKESDIDIFEQELENLYKKLKTLFSFLKPNLPKRGRRKRGDANVSTYVNIDDSTFDYSLDEKKTIVDDILRQEKIQSVFEISTNLDKFDTSTTSNKFFGLSYLSETEKKLWNYFIFSLKTASKLSTIERIDSYESYSETWSRWREFLNILIRFMNLQLKLASDSEEILNSLFHLNLISISSFKDQYSVDSTSYCDALLTLIDFIFINSESPIDISAILSTDLTLSHKYNFSENPFMIESRYKGSGICLDSIPTRARILSLTWIYAQKLNIDSSVMSQFRSKALTQIMNLESLEFLTFFTEPTINSFLLLDDNVLFSLSFDALTYITKAFSITSNSFFDDIPDYLNQVDSIFKTYQQLLDEFSMDSNKKKDQFEKIMILVKYQLQQLLKLNDLNDKEWDLLNNIKFIENKREYSLAGFIKQ